MREHLKDYIDQSRSVAVRGLRILLEYFYAVEAFEPIVRDRIKVVSVFGSARTGEGTPEYEKAYQLGKSLCDAGFAVVTGGSSGIMQAANQGVADYLAEVLVKKQGKKTLGDVRKSIAYARLLKKHSVGLKISLPFEPTQNPYVGVNATFHYFMVRKFFFATLSSAFIACEGGWGTRDELFEILTLVQTGKAPLMPIVYVSATPEHLIQDIQHALDKGYIHPEDLRLIDVVKTTKAALAHVTGFYKNLDRVEYTKPGVIRLHLKKPLDAARRATVERLCEKLEDEVGPFRFNVRTIDFSNFPHSSYGYLRQVIDVVNKG